MGEFDGGIVWRVEIAVDRLTRHLLHVLQDDAIEVLKLKGQKERRKMEMTMSYMALEIPEAEWAKRKNEDGNDKQLQGIGKLEKLL